MTRREFGSIRRTSAGRYQARYTTPDGSPRKGPHTFSTKRDAADFLSEVQVQLRRRSWLDPKRRHPTISEYFSQYQDSRIGRGGGAIRASTRALSEDQFRRYIEPSLGQHRVDALRPSDVNRWYAALPDRPALRRQLYSLLKSMLQQAIRDQYVHGSNPCQIPRAGQNPPSSRRGFEYADVALVLELLPLEIRVLAGVAYGAHLRLGEVPALRWECVDLESGAIEVVRSVTEVHNEQVESATKTGRSRIVQLPQPVAEQLRTYARARQRDPQTRLFLRPDGSPLRHFHVHRHWKIARRLAGLDTLRFHDLRHVGLTALAEAGLPLRSIMYRAGHSTVEAALVYQHRAQSRNLVEAEALAVQMSRHHIEA